MFIKLLFRDAVFNSTGYLQNSKSTGMKCITTANTTCLLPQMYTNDGHTHCRGSNMDIN